MNLNKEEKELCQQLRDRVADVKITDSYRIMDLNLIRFLRARNMDLDNAEEMFRKYVQWREENDIDNALNWDVAPDLKENFRYKFTGLSHNGGLVLCVNVGDWNPELSKGRQEELLKIAYYSLENMTRMNKYFSLERNKFSKIIAIINLENLGFAHCTCVEWIKAVITLLKIFESCYPESLTLACLINAPWVFSILWSITRPFISTATHERIRFLGSDPENWKSEILKYVAEDQFPARFGGQLPEDFELVYEDGKVVGKRTGSSSESGNETQSTSPLKPVDSIDLD